MLKPRAMTVAAALIASCIAALLVGPAPATAKTASTFSEVRESCMDWDSNREAPCYDFVDAVSLEPLDGAVRVSWTAGADRGVPCFYEYGSPLCPITSQGAMASVDPVSRTGGGTCIAAESGERSCIITGLKNGVQYSFKIYSDVPQSSGFFVWKYITPLTSETISPCCSVPGAPSQVTATPTGNSVDVTWAQPTDWGGASALTYRVSTTPESTTCEVQVLACRLENVPRGVPVVVNVTASNAAGSSTAAVSPSFRIPVTAPEPPPSVTATYPRPGTAKVSWTAPVNDGGEAITTYVARARPGGRTCTTAQRSCTITGLPGGKTYSFTVTAANGVGTSQPSPTGVAGVLVNPASAPRDASASVSGSSARVSWARPASLGGGRLLQYIVRAGSSTCTAKATSCTLSRLALGRTYPVTVTAVTTGGRSRPATTSLTTVAPQPVKPTQTLN